MKSFSRVCQQLESVPFHRSKSGILAQYLKHASPDDASWALYLLLGGQLPRLLTQASLQARIMTESGLPAWLVEECREQAADFAETVALLGELSLGETDLAASNDSSLTQWIEERLMPLARTDETQNVETAREWWRTLSLEISWAVHALALGRFPVHVSRRVAEDALREAHGHEAAAALDTRLAALSLGEVRPSTESPQLNLFS